MTARPTLFSAAVSLTGRTRDALRRVRLRRAELHRLAASELVADPPAPPDRFRWRADLQVDGRQAAVLECPPSSRVTYAVALPSQARATVWGGVTTPSGQPVPHVELALRVAVNGAKVCERRVITAGGSGDGRPGHLDQGRSRWHHLSVRAPASGPALITLEARLPAGASADGSGAIVLWRDPRIEAPRPVASWLRSLRSSVSGWTLIGLWDRLWPVVGDQDEEYARWVRRTAPSARTSWMERRWSASQTATFTLYTFVADPARWRPAATADSIRRQTYRRWEWLICASADVVPQLRAALGPLADDPRVRLTAVPPAGGAARAWNEALSQARGAFAAIVGSSDQLEPDAVAELARLLERYPDADLVYSDEDRLATDGRRHEPRFKPGWSPELLLATNYIGRLAMVRVGLARQQGGFREGYDGAEEWDLFLRLSRVTGKIHRVTRCLYHRRESHPRADAAQQSALVDHCLARGLHATADRVGAGWRVRWPPREPLPRVSIVIPSRDAAAVLTRCLDGLLHATRYPHREIVIVDNGSTDRVVLDTYAALERAGTARVVPFDRPFNFSAACNAGAAAAAGDVLLFLNNDVEVIHPDWLDQLVQWTACPEVGIVGARLLYPNGTIQHAGVVLGLGLVGHVFSGASEDEAGPFGTPACYRNYLAVTGACLMMRRDVYDRLGGFDERFRVSFSDVVLCLEAWKAGYRVVYTPYARLIHHESYTRTRDDSPQDTRLLAQYLLARPAAALDVGGDPFFHPELNPRSLVPRVRPSYEPTPSRVVQQAIARVVAASDMGAR